MSREITLSGIRKECRDDGRVYLVSDICFGGFEAPYAEREIWFAVAGDDGGMLEERGYDAFFLVPLYLAMYHKATLRIEGAVSRTFYRNMMDYGQQILCNFSQDLSHVEVIADRFEELDYENDRLIGTGISCGVDSLSTIYDRYVNEADPDYRVNALFLFDCGTHGDYEDDKSRRVFRARLDRSSCAALELGLPVHQVNSNLHAFTHKIGEQKLGYFAIYSCALSLQRGLKRHYASSTYSYSELLRFYEQSHDFDMAEYCESYLVPLICTENFSLVLDGAQYKRSEKVKNIADWDIAKKHLNVCINPGDDGTNCSVCSKCKRTIIDLEALGLLDDYTLVFDVPKYRKIAKRYKLDIVSRYGEEGFTTDNVDFAREHDLPLPNRLLALAYRGAHGAALGVRRLARKVLAKVRS